MAAQGDIDGLSLDGDGARRRTWLTAAAGVAVVHAAVIAAALLIRGHVPPPVPEQPVVVVELPPLFTLPQAIAAVPQQEMVPDQPQPDQPRAVTAPVEAPVVNAPLPREVVAAAPPQAAPVRQPRPAAAPAPAPVNPAPSPAAASAPSNTPGTDPRARQQEVDYFSLVNAHLARNKRYPREARQARQEGVVTVRFTVSRDGRVSNATIRNSSGHDLLDQATLDLLQRVSPLPRFPRSMTRDSVTLTLPIEYSLRTN